MLKSKAAWALSRPGNRWRTVTTLKATGISGASKLKFQGGYFLAASGGTAGASKFVSLHISNNLVNWDVKNILGAVLPPVIDVACDGTYAYIAYFEGSVGPAVNTRITRYNLSTGVSSGVTIPKIISSIDCLPSGKLFYTYTGIPLQVSLGLDPSSGFGYITSWPTYTNINYAGGSSLLLFSKLAGVASNPTNDDCCIVLIRASEEEYSVIYTNGSLEYNETVWTFGTAANAAPITAPVYSNIPASGTSKYLWTLMTGVPLSRRLRTHGLVPGVISSTIAPTNSVILMSEQDSIAVNAVLQSFASELYIVFNSGTVWKTRDLGATDWEVVPVTCPNAISMISSNKGLVVAATDGTLYVSP